MRVGLLTGGGDAPGLNGIIESTTKALMGMNHSVIGIQDGFEGILEGKVEELTLSRVEGIHDKAGTILGTNNRCGTDGREAEFVKGYKKLGLDGLVVAGGDGTFRGLANFKKDIAFIGVPKTIDNDLSGTDFTFGYDTACSVVAKAINSLRRTADAHRRLIFVETMGRTAGHIALGGGMAGYADAILIPERPFAFDDLIAFIQSRRQRGQRGFIVVVAEGASPKGETQVVSRIVEDSPQQERLGGIAELLALRSEVLLQEDSRHVVLGHLQRSAPPTTTDRFLCMSMGVAAARLADQGKWHQAVAYKKGTVVSTPVEDFFGPVKTVRSDHHWVRMALAVGIFL